MPRRSPFHSRLVALHPVIGFALVLLACAMMVWSLADARDLLRREAEQQAGTVAATLERTIERSVTTLDLSLRSAMRGLAIPGLAAMDAATRDLILFDGALNAEGVRGVFIVNADGTLAYASRGDVSRDDNRADREYFSIHLDNPDPGLLVTGPVQGRTDGEWTLLFSRRLNHPDGSFAGVAAGGLHLSLFEALFQSLGLPPGATVSLITGQGRLVARLPRIEAYVGRDVRSGVLFSHAAQNPRGTFVETSRLDDVRRLIVYRPVGDLPLTIAIAFSTRVVYAGWLRSAEIAGLVLLLLGGLDILLGQALRRELRQRALAELAASAAWGEAEMLAAELSRSLRRLEALIDNSVDAMLVARVDAQGEFTYEAVNPVWQRLTGVPESVAVGQSPRACLPAYLAEMVIAAWDECLRHRRIVRFSFHTAAEEQEQWWDAVVCPVIEQDGSANRVIGTARDVTAQRMLEAKLREVDRMEAVGGLTAGIAHDFNNLLQAMLGALELAEDEAEPEAGRRASMGIAAEAGRRAASLVHQLLAFSRKQVLNPAPLDPGRVVAGLVAASRPMLGSRHRLLVHVVGDAGPLRADAAQLDRCLTDIVLNARDAMPGGGAIHLSVSDADSREAGDAGLGPGDYVRFTVEDEGIGMDAGTLARAFEPFFTTKGVGNGTGLGLSMVQGFARQSGGDVTIESAVGLGSAVTLWLPRIPRALQTGAAAPAGTATPAGSAEPRRSLVVDATE